MNPHLSKVEDQIVRLKLQGLSQKEIAERVFRSPHTIRTHINKVYEKVGAHNSDQLHNWYLENILEIGIRKLLQEETK